MSRMVRVSLRIDRKLPTQIDRLARRRGLSRSAFIRDVLRKYLALAKREAPANEMRPSRGKRRTGNSRKHT